MRTPTNRLLALAGGLALALALSSAALAQESAPAPAVKTGSTESIDTTVVRADIERLDRVEQRLLVPFLSRRYAARTAEERADHAGLETAEIIAKLAARRADLGAQLAEANASVPARPVVAPPPEVVYPDRLASDAVESLTEIAVNEPAVTLREFESKAIPLAPR